LVLTDINSQFSSAKTNGDGALIFNVAQKDEEDMVTSNDNINNVEGVSVVAGNGTVTIQGAAGKSVVISNILGKVVAETVLTSDNATIAVPAGIVAVAVDGEEAVKVVVK
jgi:riboflavin transporter FmnP